MLFRLLWNAGIHSSTVSNLHFLAVSHQSYPFPVPTPHDPRPGRFVRHLDFNHFRTIGMRRSVEEGVNSRFVTGDRVEAMLKVSYTSTFFSIQIND